MVPKVEMGPFRSLGIDNVVRAISGILWMRFKDISATEWIRDIRRFPRRAKYLTLGALSETGLAKKKQGEVTGTYEPLSKGMLEYKMAKYQLYDPAVKDVGNHIVGPHDYFGGYNAYTLYDS